MRDTFFFVFDCDVRTILANVFKHVLANCSNLIERRETRDESGRKENRDESGRKENRDESEGTKIVLFEHTLHMSSNI